MHRLQDARGDPRAPDGLTRPSPPVAARRSDVRDGARTGRFAPSPTGDLHAGSLVAALASRCDAPRWRVRIDDIDPPREVPGSARRIVAALRAHGFPGCDAPVERQGDHARRHRRALRALCDDGHLFACGCSRRDLGAAPGCVGPCRRTTLRADDLDGLLDVRVRAARPEGDGPATAPADVAVRARLGGTLDIDDRVLGRHRTDLDRRAPDVVVLRRDGWFSYHLATAVDDAHDIDDVVRGADLFAATAVQVALMQRLGRPAPRYAHVPVVLDADGAKLSKGAGAAALESARAARSLHAAWRFLGQSALGTGADGPDAVARFWASAPSRWRMDAVPALRAGRWPASRAAH